jgi:hypothetical protein
MTEAAEAEVGAGRGGGCAGSGGDALITVAADGAVRIWMSAPPPLTPPPTARMQSRTHQHPHAAPPAAPPMILMLVVQADSPASGLEPAPPLLAAQWLSSPPVTAHAAAGDAAGRRHGGSASGAAAESGSGGGSSGGGGGDGWGGGEVAVPGEPEVGARRYRPPSHRHAFVTLSSRVIASHDVAINICQARA